MAKKVSLRSPAEDIKTIGKRLSEDTDDKDCIYIKGDLSFGGVQGEKVSDEPTVQLDFAKGLY